MEPIACPWHHLGLMAVAFCEGSVCGWVRQPGNTVSNLDFLLVGWLICRHARRHGYLHLVLLANPDLSRKFYALQSFACCVVVEGILFFTQKGQPDYRWFGAFWLSFLLGYGLWLLDVQHLACDPANHWVSGHALWHWLDALALYCVYRFYTQFQLLRFEDSRLPKATTHRLKGSV